MSAVSIEQENAPTMALKAVIIFDSRALAARAITTLENAGNSVGERVKWDIKSWDSGVLKRPDLIGVTVAVAADADLIVLALDKMHNLSDELLDWLEHWSEHRQVEDAAIMAFSPDDAQPAFLSELKWFTEWRGLNFLENPDATPKNVIRLGHLLPSQTAIGGEQAMAAPGAE